MQIKGIYPKARASIPSMASPNTLCVGALDPHGMLRRRGPGPIQPQTRPSPHRRASLPVRQHPESNAVLLGLRGLE